MALRLATSCALVLAACGADGDDGHGAPRVVLGWQSRDVEIPGALHVQGLPVPAKLFVPELEGGARPVPAVVVLHGSGGLFAMPDDTAAGDPCAPTLEPQFERWGARLAELGYVVLMPASFDARGFCDWYADEARIPADFDDKRERLLGRLYDTDAAARYLCSMRDVDCDHLGLLGFSNGASAVLLALHWQLTRALDDFAVSDGPALDVKVATLPAGAPGFRVGVAYYPGCGLEGVVGFGTDPDDDPEDMYFPSADLYIEHGGADTLVADCSVDFGAGRRELQSARVAADAALPDAYHVTVHADAEHGFDNAGSPGADEGSGSERPADLRARDAALDATLDHLRAHLD
jgi:dienelactone hydrolase